MIWRSHGASPHVDSIIQSSITKTLFNGFAKTPIIRSLIAKSPLTFALVLWQYYSLAKSKSVSAPDYSFDFSGSAPVLQLFTIRSMCIALVVPTTNVPRSICILSTYKVLLIKRLIDETFCFVHLSKFIRGIIALFKNGFI